MAEESKQYTAFTLGIMGLFECDRMPFGLSNAPATFQRLIQNCLGELNLYLSPYGKNRNKFVVHTDNNPLTYIFSSACLNAAGHSWVADLADCNFSLEYQRGKDNMVADFLSRMEDRLSEGEVNEQIAKIPEEGVRAVLDNTCIPITDRGKTAPIRAESGLDLPPAQACLAETLMACPVWTVGGPALTMMKKYTQWIRPGSFYHLRIYQLKELKKCPHLANLDPLRPDLEAPSMTLLRTHETTFEVARKNPQITLEAYEKARDKYADALQLHGCHATSATVKSMAPLRGLPTTGGRDAPPSGSGTSQSQRDSSSSEANSHTEDEDDPDQTILMEVIPSQIEEAARHSWSDRVDDEETWGQQAPRYHKRR